MKAWHVTLSLVLLLLAAVGFIYFVGISPKPISKIGLSQFENSDVVINSLYLSLDPDIQHASIFFLGIDPNDSDYPMMSEVYEKFWSKAQQSQNPFTAVVIDESVKKIPGFNAEQFEMKKEPERFIEGLKTAEKQNVHLLVVVGPTDASPKLPNSLISLARKSVFIQSPDRVAGLVFTKFPRARSEEEFFPIACNTGEADLGQTADLGCYIIQKARVNYKKHFSSGTNVGLLDQLGNEEFIFLLTHEK